MSITDELREYALGWDERNRVRRNLTAIADRIDAEHEAALLNVHIDLMDASGWVRLPKDADDVPWSVGDRDEDGNVVTQLRLSSDGWYAITDGLSAFHPEQRRHHHAPTVEDVLREFADEMNQNLGMYTGEAIDADEWRDADAKTVEKYAAKLRLAEGED